MSETMPNRSETIISPEKEKGKNVEIVLAYMRHGLRDPKNNFLTDLGREGTRDVAEQLGLKGKFKIIKPYGSSVGPLNNIKVESVSRKRDWEMGRSMETAKIFGETSLDKNQKIYDPSYVDTVNYEKFKTKPPYNHVEIYNSFIPKDYNELSDEEKNKASQYAQKKTIEHLMSLKSPEAITYKKEVAGGYALPIIHFSKMSNRLNSDTKILAPFGVHGGHMELLLQQAMVKKNESGERKVGFESLDEIGGEMDSSEGFFVRVCRDNQGKLQEYMMTFFDQERRLSGEFILDAEKVQELADFYKELHKEDLSLLQKTESRK